MYLIWNRLKYVLSPQFDIYTEISKVVSGKVADIGFGTGFGTHLFNAKAKEIYGYELDNNAINFARSVFPFKNLHFEYGDITSGNLGLCFDYVTMIDVIEHIKDDRQALVNVKAMLIKGGTLICSTPNRLSRYRKADNHYREYSPLEFKYTLESIFPFVSLKNYRLEPLTSQTDNPILAVCCFEKRK